MADEIKLKAPTVEQQVVVNINGEEKLRSFADTLEKISNNKNLQKYWKTQQELINATADAYGNFSKKASQDNAKELIKVTNALKAMSGTDLSNILPDFDKISKAMAEAQKVAGNIDSAFSVKGFKEAFDSFETLKAYGVDIQNLFSHFGVSTDVGELQKNVRALEDEVGKLTRRLSNAKNANEELRNEFENFKSGSGFADKLDELDNLKSEMSYIREEAEEIFRQFLKLNNISEDGYDREGFYDDNRFREYFQNIQSGYMSASDAIRQFKTEYSYLLEESFKTNNDTFGLEQLQAFSNKLDSIFRQVEETSTKINDIISNGVITKSVENLSMDSSLSDSQRSLFGNLLQDEESLKSITALFQKLIEESNKTSKVDLFNDEQLQQVLSIFDKIEKHLSSLRSIISDVGDGEEFSPLLKALNDIKEAASNIKLNFNMDLGDEVSERLNQKVSQASARQLEAYRKLFSAMKGTGKTNKEMLKFFEPDEASVTELIGTYKGIIERAEKQFKVGNSNIYKKYLGAEYDALKREITNANKQLSRADSKRSENGILGDLFGNTKDLSEVIEQLNRIVSKLDEISSSASEFKNVFKEGFNITAFVEEIDKLTNRVKELEDELAKVKLNPVSGNKSNISSGTQIEDVFQGDKIEQATTSAKELDKTLEKVDIPTDSFDDVLSKLDLAESKLKEIVKITKQSVSDSEGKFHDSYTLKDKRGSTEIYGLSSNTEKGQLLRSNIVEYDAKEIEKANKQILKSEQELQAQKNAFHKKNISAIDLEIQKREEESKMVSSALKTQMEERQKQLSSMESSLKSYQDKAFDLSIKPYEANRFPKYQAQLDSINKAIKDYENHINSLQNKGVIDPSDIDEANRLKSIIEGLLKNTKKFSSGDKGFTNIGADKVLEKINSILEQNSRMSKTAKDQIKAYYNEIYSGNPTRPLNEILDSVYKIVQQEREAGRAGKSWLEVFKDKKIYSFLGQAASMFSFYDLINVGREGFQTIRELDTALTEMKKVSDETTQSLKNYQSTTFDVGDAVGATAKTIQISTADWMRLGESINEAAESAKASNILLNVSEFESIDEATESLVAMSQAYSELGKMDIIDVLNNIGNNYSIATDGLATALQKSASALKTANNDLNSAVALATAGNAVVQDPDSVGAGIRTISLRLVGTEAAKQELESIGEETDDVITTTSKLRDTILSATAAATNDGKGFDIFDSNGNYKSTYEIMQGLADLYDDIVAKDKELGTNNLNLLLETIAGKNRSNIAASILQNGEMLRSVYQDAQNSSGSAQKELDSYLDSIDGRMTQLENRAQEFWYKVIDSDTIKNGITLLTDLLELGTNIVDTFGVLPTIMAGVGAGLSIKNVGRPKMFGLYKYADINMCSLGY